MATHQLLQISYYSQQLFLVGRVFGQFVYIFVCVSLCSPRRADGACISDRT